MDVHSGGIGMALTSVFEPQRKRQRTNSPPDTIISQLHTFAAPASRNNNMSDSQVVDVLSTNFPVLEEGDPFEPLPILEYPDLEGGEADGPLEFTAI